jgi:hypothetical protein
MRLSHEVLLRCHPVRQSSISVTVSRVCLRSARNAFHCIAFRVDFLLVLGLLSTYKLVSSLSTHCVPQGTPRTLTPVSSSPP